MSELIEHWTALAAHIVELGASQCDIVDVIDLAMHPTILLVIQGDDEWGRKQIAKALTSILAAARCSHRNDRVKHLQFAVEYVDGYADHLKLEKAQAD